MKRILNIIAVLFTATILSGSGNKSAVWKYELPLSFYGEFDSIPTINQFGQVRNGIIVDNIISVYNADPNGVDLTNTQIEAFRMLVGGMYTTGTWQKCKAIYPFIGGSAYKHKWNIKDLRDLSAAFTLTFPNGMTHSANGIQGNGTNQYADTFISPSLFTSGVTITYYLNTIPTSNTITGSGTSQGLFNQLRIINSQIILSNSSTNDIKSFTNNNTGCFSVGISSTSSSVFDVFNVGRKIPDVTGTTGGTAYNSAELNSIFIFATNGYNVVSGSKNPSSFINVRMPFMCYSSKLTDTEAIRLSNIVTQVQRHLSRQ